ncbi:putative hydroxymethylglutaryl-CoA synthase [Waddlia chondrophila 2032/99]|uniref:Putative hydroxymethylglutaryl-CoA synthase n=2 Tax=Waddlia chondrophila TaxID=71667 RepID=D6YWG1_WADCW|nr:hydroxymethylglutaryl-CoA synthase [Waddlia chondrophila]ADI38472.1 putative hydroxymethylglutaryl-CoA synthase [Waddlia chondrophila WSU 86-1044]CCB91554.1 putative hydroxymethylglutaryl-CoA synthase [Waddlia chondrophila 2032/99]
MSTDVKVGISDIAIYLPRLKIDLETIIKKRASESDGKILEKVLKRALEKTGVLSMHFPESWEDSVTMAAQAALKLINRKRFNLKALRYLVSGTETTVDYSKPLSSYVIGILKKAGISLPQSISTFQTQHACAGGTVALMAISALLGFTQSSGESGIVLCSDIARYGKYTSAEMTQGAGAIALLTETDPKLIELDLKTAGYSSKDVDDFFRPLGSEIAKVKGGFSVRCYMEAMDSALVDLSSRSGKTPKEMLTSADMYALHVPYPKLPTNTMEYLLGKYVEMDKEAIEKILKEKGFYEMTAPASKSGNIYTGSMFMSLAFLLKNRYNQLGNAIVGKKILMGSYGSGNTMVFMSGIIAPSAPEVIKNWDLEEIWDHQKSTIQDYESWIESNGKTSEQYASLLESKRSSIQPDMFFLDRIREDGYREYSYSSQHS